MASYPNGQVPTSALSKVGNFDPIAGAPPEGGYVQAEADRQLIALQNAFYAHFKKPLNVSEGYRSYARQVELRNLYLAGRGNLAAYPGTSIHGWALASDFGSNVDVYGSAEKNWMDGNAHLYGWSPTGNGFNPREAWHFDYVGGATLIAPIGIQLSTAVKAAKKASPKPIPPAPTMEEVFDDMIAVQTANASTKATAVGIPKGAKFLVDMREKTIERVDANPTLTAEQLAIRFAVWNTFRYLQPSGAPIGWGGDLTWNYINHGGFKRIGW